MQWLTARRFGFAVPAVSYIRRSVVLASRANLDRWRDLHIPSRTSIATLITSSSFQTREGPVSRDADCQSATTLTLRRTRVLLECLRRATIITFGSILDAVASHPFRMTNRS
jgi:hypothetical protein